MSAFAQTALPGVVLITPTVFTDDRGWFFESYRQSAFASNGIADVFIQDNHSRSQRGSLRGLHYQVPPKAQAKLVRAVRGAVFDVAVDLRAGSPTAGRWMGVTLSADNHQSLYVPVGCAHGFCALTDVAEVQYKISAPYDPALERGIVWDDPDLQIAWPSLEVPYLISDRDRRLPRFADLTPDDNPF